MRGVRLAGAGAPDRLPLAGLVVLVAAVFHEALFTSRVFFQRDVQSVWYPQVAAFVRAVAEGAWPLWNPYPAFGLPLLADPSAQLLYPPTWLNLVMPPELFYKLFVVSHCLFSAAGMYRLARLSGLAPAAGFVAAAAWAASGPFLSAASLYHHYAGMAWMPWVLVALHRLLERPTTGRGLVLGSVAAAQVVAGSGEVCVFTGMAAIAYVLCFRFASSSRSRLPQTAGAGIGTPTPPQPPHARRAEGGADGLVALARSLALAVATALLLSAAQWMPTVALARHTARPALPRAFNMYWSLHPASLLDLLAPRLVEGLPMSAEVRGAVFEAREPFLTSVYLGLPLAALAVLGATGGGPRGRRLGLAFVFFVLAALGRYTPVYPLLLRVPGLALFRYPVKYMFPATLFWGLLAGLGMQAWLGRWEAGEKRRAALVVAGVATLAVAFLVLGAQARRRPQTFARLLQPAASPAEAVDRLEGTIATLRTAGALGLAAAALLAARTRAGLWPLLTAGFVMLVAADLVAAGSAVNPLAPPELMRHRPPLLQKLPNEPRVFVFPYPILWLGQHMSRGPQGWQPEWRWTLGSIERLQPPTGGRWRVHGSFDGDFTGLAPLAASSLGAWVERGGPLALRLLQMGGVGHVVALHSPPIPGLTEVGSWPSVFTEPIRLFQVADPLPRAYAVQGVRIADEPASYAVLADPTFDPRREVILPAGSARAAAADFTGRARVARRRSDALGIEAELSSPGYVVLLEAYERGWRATVDGEAADVLRANVVFRAVAVPAGRHVVEFRYRPPGAVVGAWISLVALLGGLALVLSRQRASP